VLNLESPKKNPLSNKGQGMSLP